MLLSAYQSKALETALPTALNFDYLIPGFVAEVGEVFGKVAKSVRDEWPEERLQEELKAELGDCAWFVVLLQHVVGYVSRGELNPELEELTQKEVLTDLVRAASKLTVDKYFFDTPSNYWIEVLYGYVARVAMVYDLDMQDVLEYNINKLESRKARGTLKGSGDYR